MASIIRLPKLGLSDWGEIVEWKVAEGDRIETGEVIAVLESDKSAVDIEATTDGVVLTTYVDRGEEIQIEPGRPIAAVGEEGEPVPDAGTRDSEGVPESEASSPSARDSGGPENRTGETSGDSVKITPKARKTASEHGIDPGMVSGTGPNGAVTATDVERFVDERDADSSAVVQGDGRSSDEGAPSFTVSEVRERSPLKRTAAERLSKSAQEKPHVKGSVAVSIEALEQALNARDDDVAGASVNDLLLRAIVLTLREHPRVNAVFDDDGYRLIEEVNLGYAVDTDRGLVVPVVEEATELSVSELAKRRKRVVGRVLEGKHDPADLQGATFTVNNVGALGLDSSFSIINPPQVAILVIGRRRPELFERDGEVVTERAVTVSLIIDHRVLDGGDAGRFLQTLKQYVEDPTELFE